MQNSAASPRQAVAKIAFFISLTLNQSGCRLALTCPGCGMPCWALKML
jgi:hypothetical protein